MTAAHAFIVWASRLNNAALVELLIMAVVAAVILGLRAFLLSIPCAYCRRPAEDCHCFDEARR